MLGIFDSGVGGLTVARAIRERAPQADIVYFGDVANAPYGTKDHETLERLTLRAMRLLRAEGATQLVSACNSTSVSVIRPLLDLFGIQDSNVVEMVGPIAQFLHKRINGCTVVVATPATVRSGMYQEGFRAVGLDVQMISCSELAGAIEFGADTTTIQNLVDEAVSQALKFDCNTLVLGCTHYPFVKEIFEKSFKKFGKEVTIIDPAHAVAQQALMRHGILGNGLTRLLLSKKSQVFERMAQEVFAGTDFSITVIDEVAAKSLSKTGAW